MIEFFDTETIYNRTVLICNSQNYLWNSKGLTSLECIDFLFKTSQKYNYFFRIDYDVNMIIKDWSKKDIIKLYDGEQVYYKGYTIIYYKDKILSISKDKKRKRFFDVSNFFNTSLLNTIKILEIELTDNEKKFIELMKSSRSDFKLKDKDKIIEYSLLENKIGLKIVNKIYELIPGELKTYNLYGSSVLANNFLNLKRIKGSFTFSTKVFEEAYFGGRMECFKIGRFKNIYKYDINSAYPAVIKDLREPLYYDIKKYDNEKIVDTNIYEVEFEHQDKFQIGTLPIRLKNGYLVFPMAGKGYYYGVELKQAIKRNIKLKIYNYLDIKLGDKLFNCEIEKYYLLRQELKKKNDKRNLIIKILLNSIYGKFAQSTGKPRFRNLYLAGYITASVRAKLLEATYKKDEEIIFFATDGILSKCKLDLPISYELGDWELINIREAYVILSGVYKLIDLSGKIHKGERGYKLDFDELLKAIKEKGYYDVKLPVFISNVYAYKNYKMYLKDRCKFIKIKKRVDIKQQHKRIFLTFNINSENNSQLLTDEIIKKINNLPSLKDFTANIFDEDFDII